MRAARLAEDAVSIRRVRLSGMGETALRRQLAAQATPRLRRFVFVRRVTLRGAPERIGQAMQAALAKLAEDGRDEVLAFTDFPALAVACARAAESGGLGDWHWRMLDVPPTGPPGEAIAALLAAYPLEAGAAVAALAERGLLAAVWRSMPEPAAARLTASLALAAGIAVPAWPGPSTPVPEDSVPEALLDRAAAVWSAVLAPLPPQSEAVRAAVTLALLRWAPGVLRVSGHPAWPALLARLTAQGELTAAARIAPADTDAAAARLAPADTDAAAEPPPGEPAPEAVQSPGDSLPAASDRVLRRSDDPAEDAASAAGVEAEDVHAPHVPTRWAGPDPPRADDGIADTARAHGLELATGWGGVLFLINALQRLDVESVLAAPGAPTGWRLLHALGRAFGMPEDETLAEFLAAQDLDTAAPPALVAQWALRLEMLYGPDGLWPLPLEQPGRLRATETHLDLDLATTEIDIRLRLAGLDLDPGWVPWLGRVVSFHYDRLPIFQPRRP